MTDQCPKLPEGVEEMYRTFTNTTEALFTWAKWRHAKGEPVAVEERALKDASAMLLISMMQAMKGVT